MFASIQAYQIHRWFITLAVGLAAVSCGQAYGWPLAGLDKIARGEAGFALSDSQQSWVVTSVFLGNVFGPVLAGLTMDRLGRKTSMALFSTAIIASWCITIAVRSAYGLYTARFLAGIWAGVLYMVCPVYIGEVVPPEVRGAVASLFSAFYYIGTVSQTLVGPYVSYVQLAILSLVIPVLLFFALLLLPETPYYKLMRGDRDEAIKTLTWINGKCEDQVLQRMESGVKEQLENKSSYRDILRYRPTRKAFVILLILGGVQKTSGMSVMVAYGSVIVKDSFISKETSLVALNMVYLITCLACMNFIDYFGRRKTFVVSCAGSGLTMGVASLWYFLYERVDPVTYSSSTWIPLVAFFCHGFVYTLGLASIPSVLQGELFAVNMKAKCSVLTNIFRAAVPSLVVKLFQPITDLSGGIYMNLAVCALSGLFGTLYGVFFMIETTQKTLEQIQSDLCSKKNKRNGVQKY